VNNKMPRDRVCAAIIKESKILMVYVEDGPDKYWTLPGGGIEINETHEEAVIREVKEETGLDVTVERLLFQQKYSLGQCYGYLVSMLNNTQIAKLGYDPELEINEQVLKKIEWIDMNSLRDDIHVSEVLKALKA
jgi:8-oxo-dGTP diphosphatase